MSAITLENSVAKPLTNAMVSGTFFSLYWAENWIEERIIDSSIDSTIIDGEIYKLSSKTTAIFLAVYAISSSFFHYFLNYMECDSNSHKYVHLCADGASALISTCFALYTTPIAWTFGEVLLTVTMSTALTTIVKKLI